MTLFVDGYFTYTDGYLQSNNGGGFICAAHVSRIFIADFLNMFLPTLDSGFIASFVFHAPMLSV